MRTRRIVGLVILNAICVMSTTGCTGRNSSDPTLTAAPGVTAPATTGPAPVPGAMHAGSGAMRGAQQVKPFLKQ